MIHSVIVTGEVMDGSAMSVMHRVLLTTILMNKVSSEPLMLTGIYLERQSPTSCLTLQTRFDSAQSLAIRELVTLSSMAESHRLRSLGLGVLTLGLISTIIIAISALPRRAMQMARSLISQ
jgi:hypothetical protein